MKAATGLKKSIVNSFILCYSYLTMGQKIDTTNHPRGFVDRLIGWFDEQKQRPSELKRLKERLLHQEEQIRSLGTQLTSEKRRVNQLFILGELSLQLKILLDQPVAAQLVVNAIHRALGCALATILTYDPIHREFVSLAMAGEAQSYPPPAYHQRLGQGMIGRAARTKKIQISNDTRQDPDHFQLSHQNFLSEVAVPLIQNGYLKGVLVVDSNNTNAFSNTDIDFTKQVSEQLLGAWERSDYHQRLTGLIQAGITLSTMLDLQSVLDQLSAITRQTLGAKFVYITLQDREGNFTRTAWSGNAPTLLQSLKKESAINAHIHAALEVKPILRLRDIRNSRLTANLEMDSVSLRSLLAFPIRLQQLNMGTILVFGKQGESLFSENDESLANLIASQAAAAIESTWLHQELRATLNTATLLYQLSIQVIRAEQLSQAAEAIAETAFRLGKASDTGIVLFTPDKGIMAEVQIDQNGSKPDSSHPRALIDQALKSEQTIVLPGEKSSCQICIPLRTPHRTYGALWLHLPESHWYNSRYAADLQTLSNQATLALERSFLLVETRQQAHQIESAYKEMETTYDQTLVSLTSALDARDRETEGHSARVGEIACRLGSELGLTPQQLKALERGALLHDIGKIGISDSILHKPGPLNPTEWRLMKKHPDIGARIVEGIPFLADTIPVIRSHQERWDASGYPEGLSGTQIPLLARIFAVADAFDALISNRPYRQKTSIQNAADFIHNQSGVLFDPAIADLFDKLMRAGRFDDLLIQAS